MKILNKIWTYGIQEKSTEKIQIIGSSLFDMDPGFVLELVKLVREPD
jgi:hypothetical protein